MAQDKKVDVFEQINALNALFNRFTDEILHVTQQVYKKPIVSAAVAGASSVGMAVGALFGGAVGPIGAVTGLASAIGGALAGTHRYETRTRTVEYTEKKELIPAANLPKLKDALADTVSSWNDSDWQTELTLAFALCNGCALYGVPKEVCNSLLDEFKSREVAFAHSFAEFVYSELKLGASTPEVIAMAFDCDEFKGDDQPYVVSLYLFVEAIARYFPDKTDRAALDTAKACFARVPKSYQAFMLAVSEPEKEPFLLPRLCCVPTPVTPQERAAHYNGRQHRLHLTVPVCYQDGDDIPFVVKLKTLLDSEKYALETREVVLSVQRILRNFAHTSGNMSTLQLEDITEKLFTAAKKYDDPELRALAQRLVLETQLKQDLRTDIQMLHLRCREDGKELFARIRNSFAPAGEDGAVGVADLLDSAVRLCLYRVLYNASDRKAAIARDRIRARPADGTLLRPDFEAKVIAEKQPCLTWLQSIDPPIRFAVTEDDIWQAPRMYESSFMAVLLQDILAELVFNALKYGDLTRPIQIAFGQDGEYRTITLTNALPAQVPDHLKGNGLSGLNEMLHILNGYDMTSVACTKADGSYQTQVILHKGIFLPSDET